MRLSKAYAAVAVGLGMLAASGEALADKPSDDFLNPQPPGTALKLFGFWGPGFRATLENKFQPEEDMSEVRSYLIGDANFGFSEASANIDARFFLLQFGLSAAYHYEWHVLKFRADATGKDHGELELNRDARRFKEDTYDWQVESWPWVEARVGALWPAYNFMGVTFLASRWEDRPDDSFDWFNSTVMNGGQHWRWETYLFVRDPMIGFIGPAFRLLNVPRMFHYPTDPAAKPAEVRETDFHYGIIGGYRPNWASSSDVFLVRVYTTLGLDDPLFGTHRFRIPVQYLVGYQADIEL